MTDWIHCNNCYTRLRSTIKFYITSCGHINCQLCASKMNSNSSCLICNSPCEVIQLTNNLKPNIQTYFRPAFESVDTAKQVCCFQLTNSLALIRNITAKYNNAKGEIQKAYKMIQDLKKEQQKLKMMLKASMKSGIGNNSTPLVPTSLCSRLDSPNASITPISRNAGMTSFMQYDRPGSSFINRGNNGRLLWPRRYQPAGQDSTSSQIFLTPSGKPHDRPVGLVERPAGLVDRPGGLVNRPAGLVDRPAGLVDRPAGLVNRPAGLVNRPAGLVNRPAGLVNRPAGLLDRIAGLVDYPVGLLDRPVGQHLTRGLKMMYNPTMMPMAGLNIDPSNKPR